MLNISRSNVFGKFVLIVKATAKLPYFFQHGARWGALGRSLAVAS